MTAAQTCAVARPGDTLLIGVPSGFDQESAAEMKRQLEQELPGVSVVIAGPVSSMTVYRGGSDDAGTADAAG